MAKKRDKRANLEIDLHGLTVEQLRVELQHYWPQWVGLRRVGIIHGQGTALRPEVQRWCEEMGIPFTQDPYNPGELWIYPYDRTLPERNISTTLRDKGLKLTPEQEAYLRDPKAIERARQEELRRKQEEEQRRRLDEAAQLAQQRRDEALWRAEVARLDKMDRNRVAGASADKKPLPPRVAPPTEIKHQEGYWRSELVRVADTDTDTLKKQKRTGLEKLAPPMPEAKPTPQGQTTENKKPSVPVRDTAAEQALFEAEMARLSGFEPEGVHHRSKLGD